MSTDLIKELSTHFHDLAMACPMIKEWRRSRPVVTLDKDTRLGDIDYENKLHDIITQANLCVLNELELVDDFARNKFKSFGVSIEKKDRHTFILTHKSIQIVCPVNP